ncbi:MAG: T9SS type B sorting domain-containing protein [Flavobacterium sp.]|nr:MAG: T9SS type B sorting domain-containing protein [Flavobacterium sp.]
MTNTLRTCLVFFVLLFSVAVSAQENCNNGIDDDGDGLIDLNDPECVCSFGPAPTPVVSIIPNPSFEDFSICPDGSAQLNRAIPWLQATNGTSDYFNCGFVYEGIADEGLDVFPDGNGAVGAAFIPFNREYIGTPVSTLFAGEDYQFTFQAATVNLQNSGVSCGNGINFLEPVKITLYGCADGTNLPLNTFQTPSAYDPTWIVIGEVTYVPQSEWQEITILFSPTININAIMFGCPEVLPASFYNASHNNVMCYPFLLFDSLILNDAAAFDVNIVPTGSYCAGNLVLTANITNPSITDATYQWYLDGIAISGATNVTYNVPMGEEYLGDYKVKVSNSLGCAISSAYIVFNIIPYPTFTVAQPTCIVYTGTITVTTPGTSYSVDGGFNWQTSNFFDLLPLGDYYVMVKTGIGCVSTAKRVTIALPPSFIYPELAVTNVVCGQLGSITVLTTGSSYSFDDGATWTSNPTATGLSIGDYTIRIKDINGCISNPSYAEIIEDFVGTATATSTNPSCAVLGSITVTSSAVLYSFDGGDTWSNNPVAQNLTAGNYTIFTRNASDCLSNPLVIILTDILLTAPEFTFVLPSCGTLGSITITTPASEYSFDGGLTWTTNPVATGLASGDYSIVIKNNLGCISYPTSVDLNENYIPSPTYTFINPQCPDLGSITITTVEALYSFDNGVTWTTNPTKTDLGPGVYIIRVKNSDGCESAPVNVTLAEVLLPQPQYSLVSPSCADETGSGITITITTPAAEYSFDNGVTWTTNPVKTNLNPGIYYFIRIKNALGCISKISYVLTGTQSALPNAPLFTTLQPIDCTNLGSITITTTAVQYSFDNGVTWGTSNTASNLFSGTYHLKVKLTSNGCPSLPSTVVIVPPPDAPNAPTIALTHPASCTNPFGFITVTSLADQYSFDNGITYSTNPVSPQLPSGTYQVRIKKGLCVSSPTTAVLDPLVYPSAPTLTLTQPDCTNPNGTITIDSPASEYSFDDGVTWNTNPIFSSAPPATYLIKIKNAFSCVSAATTAVIIPFTAISPLPNALPQTFCIQDNATLADVVVDGEDINWYDALTGGTILPLTTPLSTTVYYASQTINSCESARIAVPLIIQNTPVPTAMSPQTFCASQNPILSNLIVTGTVLRFYDSASGGNLLPASTLLQNGITYHVSQTINGCESVQRLPINVILIDELPANNFEDWVCDDLNDGEEKVDLTVYQEDIIANSFAYTFAYYTSISGAENELSSALISDEEDYDLSLGGNIIYVRVEFNNQCYKVVELKLTLVSSPFINMKDSYYVCENGFTTLTADAGFDTYTWSTGATTREITVTVAGNYSVTVTKNHGTVICSSTKNITVDLSNKATILEIKTFDWTSYDNSITIIVSGQGIYEYSLDGIHFQSSNQFFGLPNGEYTVYVNDINGCGVAEEDVYLLMYPKFFTPNGDTFNDVWGIKFHENEPNLKVHIFDRYGKFLKQLTLKDAFWDGTYNGEMLPSTDYWFVVIRENGKEHRGHFSLKR